MDESADLSGRSRFRLVPLAVIGVGLALFFATGLDDYLTFETLRENRVELLQSVERAGGWAIVLFGCLYAVAIAFSLPLGALLTIIGGFLFGPVAGTAASVCGATVGATAVFVAARTAFGDILRSKARRGIDRMARGFEEDAFSYLLTLRLIPLFPFWLVNIAPAFTHIRLRTYILATALGILPGTLVYALVGNGLGAVFEAGERPELDVMSDPAILAPIVGLAVLSLLPVVYRRFRRSPHIGPEGRPPAGREKSCPHAGPLDRAKRGSGA